MAGPVTEYLAELGAPEALVERVERLVGTYQGLLTEDIESIYVSEYRDEDADRTFESLWLFSEHFAMEAKLLGETEDQFDFVPHKEAVRHLVVRKRAYDLETATDASRMSVEIWFVDQRYGILKATGANCLNLRTILTRHLLPNAGHGVTSPS